MDFSMKSAIEIINTALNPNTSVEVLDDMIKKGYGLEYIPFNNNCTDELLDNLALEIKAVSGVAKNLKTSSKTLEKIVKYYRQSLEGEKLMYLVAGHPNTSIDVLKSLVYEKESSINIQIIKNANCTLELLEMIEDIDSSLAVKELIDEKRKILSK